MLLQIGGVKYPAAPFSGWYVCTEIGARDLADIQRYNVLPMVGKHLGFDTSRWRDMSLGEQPSSTSRGAARESPLVLAIACWNLRALSRYIELLSTSSTSVERWETVIFLTKRLPVPRKSELSLPFSVMKRAGVMELSRPMRAFKIKFARTLRDPGTIG